MKSYLLVALAVAACASDPDPRTDGVTAAYIVEAILAPHCGRAACHSTTTNIHGLAFDTVSAGIAALNSVDRRGALVSPGHSKNSLVYTVLVESNRLMPPDGPLAQADIDLIGTWIDDGAAGLH